MDVGAGESFDTRRGAHVAQVRRAAWRLAEGDENATLTAASVGPPVIMVCAEGDAHHERTVVTTSPLRLQRVAEGDEHAAGGRSGICCAGVHAEGWHAHPDAEGDVRLVGASLRHSSGYT